MSINAREKALEERLKTMVNRPPTAWPNGGLIDTGVLHLEVQHFHNQTSRPGVSTTQRRPGIFQVTVVAPENGYATTGNTVADAVAALFPADLSLVAGSETIRITHDAQPAGGRSDLSTGDWRIPISIRWEVIS